MEWVLVLVAIAVLGVAAWAGTGKLGEMPPVVTDRPKGRIPDGPLTPELLAALQLPRASSGYSRQQVDDHLSALVAGDEPDPSFDVVAGGYDMQVVDELLARFEQPTGSVAAEQSRPKRSDDDASATAEPKQPSVPTDEPAAAEQAAIAAETAPLEQEESQADFVADEADPEEPPAEETTANT
ncbi:MAG: hypothetical protein CSA64_01395 [Arachnia propionica]|nr:MAG: hypothetical protein CSA64_01395 [Arachnia propionica]